MVNVIQSFAAEGWRSTHLKNLSLLLLVLGPEHHPLGRGHQAVALSLGVTHGHEGNLSIAPQEHQLPRRSCCLMSLRSRGGSWETTLIWT